MPNAVIERLEAQRAEQLQFVDTLLSRVDAEGRDLVPAENDNLKAARQRITEIDQQLTPLNDFEALRHASADGHPVPSGPPARPSTSPDRARPLGQAAGCGYRTAGAFLVDLLRARGVPWAGQGPDPQALARVQAAALDTQTTGNTPGILPEPIIGPIVSTLDASRPFVTSIGVKPMGGIPGAQFSRPKVTQHTRVGKQTAEKTELATQKMIISPVNFVKDTFGGAVNISRQDIDWTSPSAWDALVADLAAVYGAQTEMAAAVDLEAKVLQTEAVLANTLEGWASALYAAGVKCYRGGAVAGTIAMGRLPDRIWCSLDMWGVLGAIVDVARMMAATGPTGALGTSELASFSGDLLNVPRIVVPGLPDETVILGNSALYEFYEEQIGLLSAVEPSILGVEVAYGGYAAFGMLEALAFCKLIPFVGP